ncbi:MAG: DUF3800 domain-containing protein [Armatimonadota bacterium]
MTHVGFSDESNWNKGRFRSLGLVTTRLACLGGLETELKNLLSESQINEFKWKKCDGAKERFAAEKMCDFAIEKACAKLLRVDVLVWDIQDSRHSVHGRDDTGNLQRMYYHLFRNVLRARWPNDAVWRLHPDEHTAMDWETVKDCLENVGERPEMERSLHTEGRFRIRLQKEFSLQEILPLQSAEHPLLQMADLFAGMAVFSRDKFDEYQAWLRAGSKQSRLFEDVPDAVYPSHSSRERFKVLRRFKECCKLRKLGVSLKTKRGLWTPKPENPLNFWLYEPQCPEDKAPTRG